MNREDRLLQFETRRHFFSRCGVGLGKLALLSLLSEKFDSMPPQSGGLGLEDEAFDFSAVVVLFGELDAKLPTVIRGRNHSGGAVQA